jgi:competence protein ComEA
VTAGKLGRFWALIIVLLIAAIVIGAIVAWQNYRQQQPIEISLPPDPELSGFIYLGGAINSPGWYPLEAGLTLEELLQAAGGTIDNADLAALEIYIPTAGEAEQPQRIDLNRAEAWLLEALPGIGPSRAQAIIDYRQENGGFTSITELTEVEGIGPSIYEQIRDLVTVAD